MTSLRQDLAAGRADGIEAAAHALKGAARTLACNGLGRIAERIERQGRDAGPEALAGWIDEAGRAFTAVCSFLRQEGGAPPPPPPPSRKAP